MGQLILLLLPVPRSIMMCLFLQHFEMRDTEENHKKDTISNLKKNMTVTGSYNSYMVLKSGTSVMSTR